MKMRIVVLCAVFVMAFSAMHFVEPAAAATPKGYLIDHGTKYWIDSGNAAKDKVTWKTYWYSKNVRKVYEHYSVNADYGKWSKRNWRSCGTQLVTMYKVSKTKMKLKYQWLDGGKPYISYIKTKMNTRNFYWKFYRPKISYVL